MSIALKNQVITIITTYSSNLENIYYLSTINTAYVYAETTLLNGLSQITTSDCVNLHKSPVNLRPPAPPPKGLLLPAPTTLDQREPGIDLTSCVCCVIHSISRTDDKQPPDRQQNVHTYSLAALLVGPIVKYYAAINSNIPLVAPVKW